MSETGIVNDCLVHYNSQHIQVRKDFFDLCTYNKSEYNCKTNVNGNIIKDEPNQECMAKILRLIETLTNTARSSWYLKAVNASKQGFKVPPEPPEHLIPLAYSAICNLLYNTYGESTVRNSVAALIQKGYIKRYQQNTGSIPCYALNIQTLQDALYQQAQDQSQNTLLNSTPIFKKRGRPSKEEKKGVENTEMPVEFNTVFTENNTQLRDFNTNNIRDKKEVNKKEERETPPVSTTVPQPDSLSLSPSKSLLEETLVSHPVHRFVWFDDLVNPTIMVVRLTNAFPHPHYSEMEDKRRERIVSWEIIPTLKKEGIEVEVRWEYETDQTSVVVEAQTTKPAHQKIVLTDEQADFWTRWCTIAKSPELNETAYTHVVALAPEITSTADLQSLYDFEYDRLREFAKAKGKGEPLPPRLGNLIKALPEWRQTQVRCKQEKEQDQEAHEHIPGTGNLTNWTQARLAGKQPTINYEPLPPAKKVPKDLKQIGNVTSALSPGMQERIRLAREKRQTEA